MNFSHKSVKKRLKKILKAHKKSEISPGIRWNPQILSRMPIFGSKHEKRQFSLKNRSGNSTGWITLKISVKIAEIKYLRLTNRMKWLKWVKSILEAIFVILRLFYGIFIGKGPFSHDYLCTIRFLNRYFPRIWLD